MQLTPEELQRKQQERGSRTDLLARYVEPAMTVGSSLASEVAAGLGGLATMNPDNVGAIHHAGTYIPRTESGREGLADLGELLSGAGKLAMDTPYLGASIRNFGQSRDSLIDAGYPGLAAALQTAPAFVATMLAPESRGAFKSVASDIGSTIASGGNMGRGAMAAQGGYIKPSVLAAPIMRSVKQFKFSKAGAPAVTATERAAERVGKGLESTHKTYVAEKTATAEEKPKGRNLLSH
jgi:hypothetical protein